MKRKSLIPLILFTMLCFSATVIAKGNSETVKETRVLGSFNELSASSGIDVILLQGDQQEIVVEAEEKYLDNIKTKVENNRLEITCTGNFINARKLQVWVTVNDLYSLEVEEGSDLRTKGIFKTDILTLKCSEGSDARVDIQANKLSCKCSEGSDIYLNGEFKKLELEAEEGSDIKVDIIADNLRVACTEGSDVHCKGKSKEMDVTASEGSDVKASGLLVENCNVDAKEAVDVAVHVTESINVTASEASDITISGKPKIKNIIASEECDIRFN